MCEPREPLCVAVAEQKQEHRNRERQRKPVWQKHQIGGDERRTAHRGKHLHAAHGQFPRRQMAASRSRIERIDFAIGQPIERHRRTAPGNHA